MKYTLREIISSEYLLLNDFLYEAIFIPEGTAPPPKSIITSPEMQVYIENFGTKKDDFCIVAADGNTLIGAAWVRIMNDYGHVDNDTPSLAISLHKPYRSLGIGTAMLSKLLSMLKAKGYKKTSLAVQKANYAVQMYKNLGYKIVDENEQEYIMINYL
jgi:Acetyltransferases